MAAGKALRVLPDEDTRRRISEDLDSTLFIEAAAGTGKTTALVSRMVALLVSGRTTLDRMVAVTFTEKAAGELKLRLRSEVERARRNGKLEAAARERLDAALAHLEVARLGTIHSFCADLLRERPVESGVDPLFEVAAEEDSRTLLDAAFDRWFESMLSDPPEGVRRVLHRRPKWRTSGPREMLRGAVDALMEHRDYDASWRRDPFDRHTEIDRMMARLAELAELAAVPAQPRAYISRSLLAIQDFVAEYRKREEGRVRDHDALEAALRDFARDRHWRWKGRPGAQYRPGLMVEEVRDRRDEVKRELDTLLTACDADLAPLLRDELRPVIAAYEAAKQRSGKLDFLDLLIGARDLIRDSAAVRRELQLRFSHFFVDEFQDTDPLQAEILLLLAADDPDEERWREVCPVAGKLFLVGDPKQSIYRFRRADVALYEEVKECLHERGAEVLNLSASFRSVPDVQKLVNAAFAPAMQAAEDRSQARYVPLEQVRGPIAEQPSVIVLPVPKPYTDYGRITKRAIEESFPDAVAAFVHWLVDQSDWRVEEGGELVKVRARHVCILLRRLQNFGQDVTRPYVRGLEARQVPHVLVGGRSYHEREEVLAIRNALTAIEWPDDELRVYATLRGPFFAFHDDVLLAFRHQHRRLDPRRWRQEEQRAGLDDALREVGDALALLADLHVGRNHRPIASTITQLLAAVRAHAGLAIWPTGEQALANCMRMADLARRFERGGTTSFRAFVEHLESERERGRSEDAPAVEEGTEGVRLMTVHKAKGLEFPVVILADPTCNPTGRNPNRYVDGERGLWAEPLCGSIPPELRDVENEERDRDRAEAVRLAYVAATRARDLLVVPGIGDASAHDSNASGWVEFLNRAIYPAASGRRESGVAPGCPPFGTDSGLDRPHESPAGIESSVRPGLHRPDDGEHEVVWWDPRRLQLDVNEEVGLAQQRILTADEGEIRAGASIEAHEKWQQRRSATLAAGETPQFRVSTVSALAVTKEQTPGGIRIERLDTDRSSRPGGKRFGSLVHAVLSVVPLAGGPNEIRSVTALQARLIGASEEEIEAAIETVGGTLRHPLLRRAAAASEVRRECPLILRRDDGTLVEGTLDLAFREEPEDGPRWTVVDFKTDREVAATQQRYEAQLGLYVESVAGATGEAVEGVLLAL